MRKILYCLTLVICVVGCATPANIGLLRGILRGYQLSKGHYQSTIPLSPLTDPMIPLTGMLKLVGQDGQFLGYINTNPYDPQSLLNEYGQYGSEYSTTSIWNPYSQYGSEYSNLSAFNPYAMNPPIIYNGQTVIAYLTMNKFLYPYITPFQLLELLAERENVIR